MVAPSFLLPSLPEPPFLRARLSLRGSLVLPSPKLRVLRPLRGLAAPSASLLRPARPPHEQPRDHRRFPPRRRAPRRLPALHRRLPHHSPRFSRLPRGTAHRGGGAELPDAAEPVAVAAVRVDLRIPRGVGADEASLRGNPRNDQRDRPELRARARQGTDPEEGERAAECGDGEKG